MVTLRATGVGRYFTAGFLGLWLCGWLAGECLGLWFLGNSLVALMSGDALGSGPIHIAPGAALAIGGFLLLWLAVWTLGGIAAMMEFFRLLCGVDQISAEGGGLTLVQRHGPFRRKREFPRDAVRRFVITGRGALAVETQTGTVELSRLGTSEERRAAVATLRSELGLAEPSPDAAPGALPKGWAEVITPEGERAVVPDPSIRRRQARAAGFVALGFLAGAVAVIQQSFRHPPLWIGATQLVAGAIGLTTVTVWLWRGRMEWWIRGGRLTLRRRFGASVRDVLEALRLELVVTSDSDGDEWYALEGVSDPAAAPAPVVAFGSRGISKNRRRIANALRDPVVPRQLGLYLARAANVPFEDRTTPEARTAEIAVLKKELEKSGPMGRLAVRVFVDVKGRKQA